MSTKTKETDGSPSTVQSAGSAGTVSPRDQINLALDFVGSDAEGRYIFRYKASPLRNIVGDYSDYQEWLDAQKRNRPVIDAGTCCSCQAMRICNAIVPGGSWNAYGGNGVKPCPAVRS